MKKLILIFAILPFVFSTALAQSLNDQINAVAQVQEQSEADQRAAQQAAIAAEQKRQAALAEKQRQREAAIANIQKQKEEASLADKKRDQEYQDKLRELDVQQKALQIQAEKARVDRSNDYINQELKQEAAKTDVIQSQADSSRNLSQGAKVLLEKTGEAEVEKAANPPSK